MSKTIGDIAPLQRGFDLPTGQICNGKIPVVYSNGIMNHHSSYKCVAPGVVTGRSGTIGKFTYIEDGYYWPHNTSLWVTNFYDNNPKFIYYLYQTIRIGQYSMGSGVPTLNRNNVHRHQTFIPKLEEQKKIATFLSLLDERIATQSKIIDKLQSLIKGIGKQLFMDNQNWRTVRIGELLRIGNGKDYKHLGIGKIPVYGTGGQMLLVNDYLYDGESVCIGRKGTIDTPMFLKGKFWTVDTLFYTYDFKDVLPKFCYYLFLQINWKLYNEGTGVPSLSKSTIENIKVKIPSLEQQQKICSVLDCYEHKTKSEEQILELYLSEKQYLLRQMFI
ncbi:restriction endonuclease subunit S [Leyella stercorea]|uniref:restriction endonuclease subunit S n=1 Tax=Leyella stercorea TaxID=363265 RepID=UPI0034E95F50